ADAGTSTPPAEIRKAGDSTATAGAPEEAKAAAEVATCTICGLPGHDSSACPFAHPEDIDLGDIEESDSDDELNDLYPLFSRYVSQHVGALTPKDKRGLTGGGRYFGNEKKQ
ncbi:sqrdl, partial [Symbiodinium sp. KB8]